MNLYNYYNKPEELTGYANRITTVPSIAYYHAMDNEKVFLAGEAAIREAGGSHLIIRTSWVFASQGKNFLTTGVDINECPKAPGYIIDSVLKRVDNLIIADVDAYLKNQVKTGAIDFGLKEGGTDLAVFTFPLAETKCVLADHPDIIEKVKAVRQDIIDGKLKIDDPMLAK